MSNELKRRFPRLPPARLRDCPRLSQNYTYKNKTKLKHRAFFKLKKHVDDFQPGPNENRFIFMPGLRGVGKTTLIFQLYDYLTNEKGAKQDNVLYISTDHLKEYLNSRILDAQTFL
ncbi:MAG: AAA family ATPase [Candidatus Methanofastidiosa archaeon]|nr:AAA family ATPase [Candidatus Methanofastidiosa archaeon]